MSTVPGCDDETELLGSQSALQDLQSHHDVQCDTLKALADELMARYQVSHSVADLEHAIGLYEETLRLRPAGHERQAEALNDLGVAFYYFCFHHKANEARASHSIELLREALRLRPSGHPWRHRSLHDLARALRILGYPQQGSIATIVECESLTREALQLRTPGHPERVNSLGSLASCLQLIFEHTGDIAILAKMVSMYRETVQSCPPGHAMRWVALNTLGCSLRQSFEILGGSETLAEAISVTREAKQLCPITDLERYMVLTNLSASLAFRTLYEGHPYSLPEAIDLSREALQLVPDNQPARSTLMNNLGEALKYSFRHHGDDNALTEAIICLRQAVILPAPLLGDKGGIDALQGLAEALELRFDKDKDTDSLLEAANIYRDILRSQPTDYRRHISLEGLGRILCRIGGEAWPEALSCYTEALHVCPMGSPDRAQLLSGMSKCFLEPTSQSFNFLEGITYLSKAYADSISPVSRRLRLAIVDLQQLEAAYMTTMNRIHTKSRTHDDERVLSLYTQVMSLLPLAANFGLDHGARLQALTGCDEICRNAVARAMLLGEVSQAVQMLEQGRGVFWTQALHLRGTAFDGVPDDDCQELQRLLRLFEHGAHRMDSLRQSVAQHERELERRRQLNESVQALILKIRGYPGLDRFLLPPAFDSLLSALPEGFFVVVNVSQLGHHALLLHRTRGLATGLELKSFRAGFDCATLRTRLPREGAIHARAIRIDKGTVNEFDEVLSVLWTSIVHPVVQALGLHDSQGRARPRLWWCVTGELGFLPIHAAGRYCGANTVCAADYIVSSYIPTIASLMKARHSWTPIERSDLAGLLICESFTTENSAAYLSDVFNEVVAVRERFASVGAVVLNEPAAHTSASELRSLLEKTPAHVLHMACHGIQESDPLKSAFLMHDGRLSIEDVLQLDLPHACLAFLSACQTAKGDQNAPDQAVHLAASMLFCGFRSVVGTMWSMCDEDGPKVARYFYRSLFERDQVDLDDIAYALDDAIQALRRSDVPTSRWAPFMHIGG